MNQSYNQMFTEQDLIEENKHQIVYLGIKNDASNQRVFIHKFIKNDRFNSAFKDLLDSLQNKLFIDETEDYIILVSKYLEGDNISLHLNFSNVTDVERLDYLYEYLHQAVAYIGFDYCLLNALISANQIIFIDNKLYLKEQIILDRRLNDELTFSMVAKNIGQIMQRLLITNYNELRTSKKYDDLHRFTESLIRREIEYTCFDDLFNDFKMIYFTKSFKKRHVLLGENHPNNMFLEKNQDSVLPKAKAKVLEPVEEVPVVDEPVEDITYEVTQEERAILTGPIEESIDLSKLTNGTHSLEELLVKEDIQHSEETPEEVSSIDPNDETTHYGVPEYFKEESHDLEIEPKKRKSFNYMFPLLLVALAAIIGVSGFFLMKLFDKEEAIARRPEAEFTAAFDADTLICTNLSRAYNDEYITESLWVISRDGVEIQSKPGVNKSGFKVTGLTNGVYTIKLTVTDSLTQFSDPFILEVEYLSPESKALENQNLTEARLSKSEKSTDTDKDTIESLNEYAISATENIAIDRSIYNNGEHSYKIDLSQGDASLSFNDLEAPASSTVSFWMMSNKSENITVHISGYNNGFNNYDKTMVTSTTDVLSWKVMSVQLSIEEETDNIVFRFPENDMMVWFDDLTIRSFK